MPKLQLPAWFKILLVAFAILGVLFLVLSAYVLARETVLHHLARDLGIALLIGVFVSITIERVSRERQEEEVRRFLTNVGENFIYAVYGNDFPRELFDCVRETVFGTKLLRTDYKVRGWLYDIDDGLLENPPTPEMKMVLRSVLDDSDKNAGLVAFHCRSEFKVRNVSVQAACYPLAFTVDGPFEKKKRGLAALVSVTINGRQQLPVVPFYMKQRAKADSPEVSFERSVEIAPGDSISVEIETYMVRRSYDEERWVSLVPADGMSIEVDDKNGNKDIQLDLNAPLFGKHKGVTSALKNDNTNRARLEVHQYLLPYQGVKIKWGQRQAAESLVQVA